MIRRVPLVLGMLAGTATGVEAQSFTGDVDITIHLAWREATASGGTVATNGVLDPGEFAYIRIDSVSFTNFTPPIGTFASGLMTGFGNALLDINGAGGTVGTFLNSATELPVGVRRDWRLNDDNGTINPASDGIINLPFGQFPASPGGANSTTPITNMFRMLWQPADFAARTVTFTEVPSSTTGPNTAAIYLDLNGSSAGSGTIGASVDVLLNHLHLNSITIPIAPAPPTFLAGAAAALLFRRHRQTPREVTP
jgi:hypothetical protein